MRFTTLSSFFRHLKESEESHSLPIYALILKDSFERRHLIHLMLRYFSEKPVWITEDDPFQRLIEEMRSLSLFDQTPFFIVEKELKKEEALLLQKEISHFPGRLICSFSSKNLYGLFDELENRGAILDLSQDKKWDKEKRYRDYLIQRASLHQKKLSEKALFYFTSESGKELCDLLSEVDKLSSYIGQRGSIELEDVIKIKAQNFDVNYFKEADSFVFEQKVPSSEITVQDMPLFLSLLRGQFQMGYTILHLLERNEAPARHFPRIYPKQLQFKEKSASKLGKEYFRRGLIHLFEAELGLRTDQPISPIHLYAKINASPFT